MEIDAVHTDDGV